MATEERVTYCRICEPLCGMVATVTDGELTKLRPDREHPLSKGFACPKGIAMTEIQNDPDRVTSPLKRGPDGEFERISWEQALDEIGERLGVIKGEHGGGSIGWYMGNPGAFSYSHPLWVKGFIDGLGSKHYYTASSQDVSNRFAASSLLYGSPFVLPIPDLERCELLLVVGANPMVSHGSVMSAPRIKDQLHAIAERGGRVIVVDPRRTETAREFEHVSLHPDSDAWLLLSLLHVIFTESLHDAGAAAFEARGVEGLERLAADFPPEVAAQHTGVPADELRSLARDIAAADGCAIYGRTGSCLGRSGTLVSFLLDALALVTGNLDREGGSLFGDPAIPFDRVAELIGAGTYGKVSSRVGGFPEVLGALPASLMAKEITTPGDGRMRAMFVSAGNPVLSVPNGPELEEAMEQLELCVAIDLYVTETSKHADYVLPATTFLEREDFPLPFLSLFTTPFIQMTEAVLEPRGEARQEWEVIEEIAERVGIVPSSVLGLRLLGRVGVKVSPRRLVETLLRIGPEGDRFGLSRGGLNPAKLRESPHGIVLAPSWEGGNLPAKLRHDDKKVHLDPGEIAAEVQRLRQLDPRDGSGEFPLRLIGLRELRSHNSWMHNSKKLMRGERIHAARVHPGDAESRGIAEGDAIRVTSPHGAVELVAQLTDEVKAGTVAVPHGWGHAGGWETANAAGGANVNVLASSEPEDLEPLAGMAHLNGIPVQLERLGARSAGGERTAEAAPA
ncbi:MAG TPA: molybdopterin-dependent oxidoreductase [Solirubrobacterales bacterium]|nr:molybdopterin-dependent oxidoreductase [Solirubrobacterales bacterium]